MYFIGITDKLSVPGKICKQSEQGNTILSSLHVQESCGRSAQDPLPAHLGSTTLHISPDTEISVT